MIVHAFSAPVVKARHPLERFRDALFGRYGSALERALIEAELASLSEMSRAELVRAIESRSMAELRRLVSDAQRATLASDVPKILREAMESAGDKALESYTVAFSVTSRQVAEWLRQETEAIARFVTQAEFEALQQAVRVGLDQGMPASRIADQIIEGRMLGLDARSVNAVFNSLRRDIAAGIRYGEADRRAVEYSRRLLRARAETFARTELKRSMTEGLRQAWGQAQAEGEVGYGAVMEWVVNGDPCPECLELDGEQAPVGGVFPGGVDGPPLHPNCECVLTLVETVEKLLKLPPWRISERDGKFLVVGVENSKVYGTHDTRDGAVAQLRALYSNVPEGRR